MRNHFAFAIIVPLLAALVAFVSCAQAPTSLPQRDAFAATQPAAHHFPAALLADDAPANALWLDGLDLENVYQDWGEAHAGKSVDRNLLRIGGVLFPHGIGTHANSEIVIALDGAAERFSAVVGIDDETKAAGSVTFAILVDGREAARTPILRGDDVGQLLEADLHGAREMVLSVEDGEDNIDSDHADWAGALLTLKGGALALLRIVPRPVPPPPELAYGTPPAPAIHAPHIVGGTPWREFIFRIPATGTPPLKFRTSTLPPGLALDGCEGIIRGTLEFEGIATIELTAENTLGSARSKLTIVSRADSLALTPPLGWNSWNVWGTSVDDAKVRAAADWLVRSGLAAHGFQYINIDDAWEGERDDAGRITTNERFPDMRALADYVHGKGLKLGIYSGPGPKTCAGFAASYEHEFIDARRWADWGIDLLKYDWCSYGELFPNPTVDEMRRPYELMRLALDASGRDILYSLCQYGMGDVWTWGDAVGGNYWRTTGDISDSWSSMSRIGFGQSGMDPFARPGRWNDPDMLVVGMVGWGPSLRPSHLTQQEQMTHVTLWALLAAPLLIGCDVSQMDDFTLALLTNPEVLEINQDALGEQAQRIESNAAAGGIANETAGSLPPRTEVWMRRLADGSTAVGLFNRGIRPAQMTIRWSDLGLPAPKIIRNLWTHTDIGDLSNKFTADVPAHGTIFLRVPQP